MGFTNFPNGVGIAPFSVPTMMPYSKLGQAYFLDPVNGNDGRSGKDVANAVQTLDRAYELCVAGRGDVVYLFNDGATTGTARLGTSTFSWAKANTHLIGLCAPSAFSQRARISHSASGAGAPTMFRVAAAGCIFANFQLFQGYSTDEDQICLELTSAAQRCFFSNIHVAGMGHATPAARAGSASLKLGGAENVFDHCTIGIDTITRAAANAEVIITVGTRNVFRDCLFPTFAGDAGHLWATAGASAIDRFILFQRCLFVNAIQSTATTMTAAMSINGGGSPGGMAILDNCNLYGATYWVGADTAKVMLIGDPGAANSQLIGIARTADLP